MVFYERKSTTMKSVLYVYTYTVIFIGIGLLGYFIYTSFSNVSSTEPIRIEENALPIQDQEGSLMQGEDDTINTLLIFESELKPGVIIDNKVEWSISEYLQEQVPTIEIRKDDAFVLIMFREVTQPLNDFRKYRCDNNYKIFSSIEDSNGSNLIRYIESSEGSGSIYRYAISQIKTRTDLFSVEVGSGENEFCYVYNDPFGDYSTLYQNFLLSDVRVTFSTMSENINLLEEADVLIQSFVSNSFNLT